MWSKTVDHVCIDDLFAAQLRAAKAEGELAAIKDELREFADENGFNPEMEPRELLAKVSGAFRSCAAMSDARYAEIQGLRAEMEAMRPRLIPEGMEWLVDAWPRFEDDAPLKLGDTALIDGEADMVEAVQLWIHGKPVIYGDGGSQQLDKGERVKRPAKVLDVDGVELRVGDTVYLLPGDWCDEFHLLRCHEWDAMKVLDLSPNHDTNRIECETSPGSVVCYPYPSQLTHRAPVLAADGKPLEARQTVWTLDDPIFECVVLGFGNGMVHLKSGADHLLQRNPSLLTHERPESWERLEEDARSIARDIVWNLGNWSPSGFENIGDDVQARVLDLVHRAMALAGVSE